jgi:hypothetical protein
MSLCTCVVFIAYMCSVAVRFGGLFGLPGLTLALKGDPQARFLNKRRKQKKKNRTEDRNEIVSISNNRQGESRDESRLPGANAKGRRKEVREKVGVVWLNLHEQSGEGDVCHRKRVEQRGGGGTRTQT